MEIIVSVLYLSEFISSNYHLLDRNNIVTLEPVDSEYVRLTIKPRFPER